MVDGVGEGGGDAGCGLVEALRDKVGDGWVFVLGKFRKRDGDVAVVRVSNPLHRVDERATRHVALVVEVDNFFRCTHVCICPQVTLAPLYRVEAQTSLITRMRHMTKMARRRMMETLSVILPSVLECPGRAGLLNYARSADREPRNIPLAEPVRHNAVIGAGLFGGSRVVAAGFVYKGLDTATGFEGLARKADAAVTVVRGDGRDAKFRIRLVDTGCMGDKCGRVKGSPAPDVVVLE